VEINETFVKIIGSSEYAFYTKLLKIKPRWIFQSGRQKILTHDDEEIMEIIAMSGMGVFYNQSFGECNKNKH